MVIPAVALSTIIGALNGYALTKWKFKGADLIFALMLFGCFIPFQIVLVPMARTLGFLGLALLAIITSASLGRHTFGTLGSLIFGLVGAAYCSVRGVRDALDRGAFDMVMGRRPRG
jgi:ABC-type glycerol-3-phosphate transport system permease component